MAWLTGFPREKLEWYPTIAPENLRSCIYSLWKLLKSFQILSWGKMKLCWASHSRILKVSVSL